MKNSCSGRLPPMHPKVLKALKDIFGRGGRIGAACSGGADSVLALLLLLEAFPNDKGSITILHFNHKTRPNTEIDEAFVRNLAGRLGVKIIAESMGQKPTSPTEDALRQKRMEFFFSAAKELRLSAIVQGHHKGDVAENIIMRLMRGSGSGGLCAPRPISKRDGILFLRPLLNLSKKEIEDSLRAISQEWRFDETNAQNIALRNKVRNIVMPAIEGLEDRSFQNGAARSRALLEEDNAALEEITLGELASMPAHGKNSILLSDTLKKHPALARRAVYELFRKSAQKPPSRAADVDITVENICCGKNSKVSLGKNFLTYCARLGQLGISDGAAKPFDIALKPGENFLPDGTCICVEKKTLSDAEISAILSGQNDDSKGVFISSQAIDVNSLRARNIDGKDEYVPIASTSKKNVFKMLSNAKIDILKRKQLPIVIDRGGDPIWIPCLPPAKSAALKPDMRDAIVLTYRL